MPVLSSNRIAGHRVIRIGPAGRTDSDDAVAAEEPLEVRLLWQDGPALQRKSIAITMRTPGDDFELAAGFLLGEGIIRAREDVVDVSYCLEEDASQNFNIVNVTLRPGLDFDPSRLERNFFTTSSCGVCGKASLEALELQGCDALPDGFMVSASTLCALPEKLRATQAVFEQTGGLHAAGLFDAAGHLRAVREDVGRHNAVDKLIGSRFLEGETRLDRYVLLLSGRASFELLQKALVAGIPVVAAVGAPSSLAVQLAGSFNITLAGFVKPSSLNIYTGPHRILESGEA